MFEFLLRASIKDLINVIYFLAHLSVLKDPIKIKINVLLLHFTTLLVYSFESIHEFFLGAKKKRKNKIHVCFFHIKKIIQSGTGTKGLFL